MFSPSAYPSTSSFQTPYKSAHKRSQIVRILLIAGAVLNAVMLLFYFIHFVAPNTVITDDTTEPTTIIIALMEGGVALLSVGVYIATVVFFLMWIYRANENLQAFGTSSSYSSGWTVGSWFIPFASLVIPYRATKELWNKSVPNTGTLFSALSPPAFFPIWWTFWLLSNFASNAYFRLSFSEQLSPETDAMLGALTSILSIVAALFAMKVVAEIDRQQTESAGLIGQQGISAGPPPPDAFMNQPMRSPTEA
ncbi:MAG TPA: DUF4328 domain-containing protein [Pyrinomonadaceae bacterium]|nr:DUF4328 domain-containing protein [Pyrinomonadaceae bacterium]